jgi:C-terminal processing protease CtpA/Prc
MEEQPEYVVKDLKDRQLRNLKVVNRLYGYVRYFYPNQEFEKYKESDWYKYLIYAIDQTLDSETDIELRKNIERVFNPIVPELSFTSTKDNTYITSQIKHFYYWEHQGIGRHLSSEDIYYSKIQKAENISLSLPIPDSLYLFRLDENFEVYMPIALSKLFDKKDKNWKELEKKRKNINIKIANRGVIKTLIDRSKTELILFCDDKVRYADLMIRWNIIQHFYPYYQEDNLESVWEDRLSEALKRAGKITDKFEYYQTINWMMSAINDSHLETMGNIYFGGAMATYINSYFTNIKLDWCDDDKIYIDIVPDSLRNIMSRGDQLISINDISVKDLIKFKGEYISASTPQAKMDKLVERELLKSFKEDTVYHIECLNKNNDIYTFSIQPTIKNFINYEPKEKDFISEKDNIFYINLTSHNKADTYHNFRNHITELQTAKGIVLDLRGYPNAQLVDSMVIHFSREPILSGNFLRPSFLFPDQKNRILQDKGNDFLPQVVDFEYIGTPLVVLINSKTVSYGETVIDMLKNSSNCILIGMPTNGTNGDMAMNKLPICDFIITAIYDRSGHHGKGIQPDIFVSPTLENIRKGSDIQLETAKRFLDEKLETNYLSR